MNRNEKAHRGREKSRSCQKGVSVGQNSADQIGIVDLAGARVDRLEEFIDFIIGHFLAEVGED